MITFLLQEGVLTATTISSIFTVGLVNSLRVNIVEPVFEKIIPSHKLKEKDSFNILPVLTTGAGTGSQPAPAPNKTLKWRTFLRDFFIWLVLMFFLWVMWMTIFHPIKSKINVKPPVSPGKPF